MATRRRALLEHHFGQWSAGTLRSALTAAALLGLALTAGSADAGVGGYGASIPQCSASGGSGSSIHQLDKSTGAFVRSFASCPFAPGAVSDDPTTFASQYRELLWIKNAAANQLEAIEIPGGTLGQITGPPEKFPGVGDPLSVTSCPDQTDNGDGLLGCWKNGALWVDGLPGISYKGIYNGSVANRDVILCVPPFDTPANIAANCTASLTVAPQQKDMFVEIDYMPPHLPDPTALSQIAAAFANAPSPPGAIRTHFQIDDQIPHNTTTALVPCTNPAAAGQADFDVLKAQFFGTAVERGTPNGRNAKALAFRYAMWVHNIAPGSNTASGCAEIGGNDLAVSLGSWGPAVTTGGHSGGIGTIDQQAGTFLHELGHTVGLRHGGIDNINCKPNYPSVMNYNLQFNNTVTTRPLDYSHVKLGVPVTLPDGTASTGLNEAALNENQGVGPGFDNQKIAFGPVPTLKKPIVVTVPPGGGPINWNQNATIDSSVALDIDQTTNASGGCPASPGEILEGWNDWPAVQLNFRASLDFGDGGRLGFEQTNGDGNQEITLTTALALSRDTIDIKPGDPTNTVSPGDTVPVAIFSRRDNDGVQEFDARHLDPASITLRGTGKSTWTVHVKRVGGVFQCSVQDVNGDGLQDLVCKFDLNDKVPKKRDTLAILEGTVAGPPNSPPVYFFHASDKLRVVNGGNDDDDNGDDNGDGDHGKGDDHGKGKD
jgi:hypothetical protein